MAKLYFRYGAMNSGKSTALMQVAHNYEEQGMKVLILKPQVDTKGGGELVSRLGVRRKADLLIPPELDVFEAVKAANAASGPLACVLCDESQFFTPEQAEQLFMITVDLNIPVICYGLRSDFSIKGFPGSDRPFTGPPKQVKITVQNRYIGMCWQYQLGVDAGKQIIMDDLKVQEPGPRYCHFPRRDDYGLGYFNGLLSEHLIYKEGHRNPWQWDKISGHERNEPLDCRNYAIAAYKVLPKDLDAIDRALKRLRGKAPEAPAAPVINIQQPVSRPQPSPGRRRENFLDDW